YSSAVFVQNGNASHLSPIQSRLRFRPTNAFSTNFDIEYDLNFHSVRSLGLSTNYNTERVGVQAAWSRGKRLDQFLQGVNRNTLRGSATVRVLPRRVTLQGSAAYDLLNKQMVQIGTSTSSTTSTSTPCAAWACRPTTTPSGWACRRRGRAASGWTSSSRA